MNIYLDTETTGLDHLAEIIEIGIIDEYENVLFYSRVQPVNTVPKSAINIHGITNEALENAPTWKEIHQQVCDVLNAADSVKIYNSAYDVRLLHQTARLYDLEIPDFRYQCVMKKYAHYFNDGDWEKLLDACMWMNVDRNGLTAHSAIDDCILTARLDAKIHQTLENRAKVRRYRINHKRKKAQLFLPENPKDYPYFATYRPKGYITYSKLKMSDYGKYEFAGGCCSAYGDRGWLFKPVNPENIEDKGIDSDQ